MPEKSLSEVSRASREQYEKGRTAFERNNLDYAVQILTLVLEQEPGFYECREALRATQFKKAGAGGGGFFKKMLGSTNPKVMQAQVAVRNHPLEALRLAEGVLNSDPHNLSAHKVVADAALAADFPKTAVLSLEIAFKQAPRDRDLALKLARALSKIGEGAKAESLMAELVAAFPDDSEIYQALKNVSADRTLSEGGYGALSGGEGSYRDILKDKKEATTLEQEKRDHKSADLSTSLLEEYLSRLATEPDNARLLRSIAELYSQQKNFDAALEYYEKLAARESGDSSLEQAVSEIKVKRLEYAISQLDKNAEEYPEQVQALEKERQDFVLSDCKRRLERYPSDLTLRFEYGQLLFQAGRSQEAIQELQKAQNNPSKRIQSLYYLGLCFAHRRMHDLAARTFQNAIKEKTLFDDEKKDLLYALGVSLDALGKKEDAMEQFKLIYEVDVGYRDVSARVDAHYGNT
jgi:tetratricopeptide (TPR) repeat protein